MGKEKNNATQLCGSQICGQEEGDATGGILAEINAHRVERSVLLHKGSVVYAIISMRPVRRRAMKANEIPRCIRRRRKAAVGLRHEDASWRGCHRRSGPTAMTTAVKVNDMNSAHRLVHGQERHALGHAGCQCALRRDEVEPRLNGIASCALVYAVDPWFSPPTAA